LSRVFTKTELILLHYNQALIETLHNVSGRGPTPIAASPRPVPLGIQFFSDGNIDLMIKQCCSCVPGSEFIRLVDQLPSVRASMDNTFFSPEDLELLKSRDQKFLAALFLKTNPVLLRVLATNGVFSEIAEDLVHQTWERFFTNLDKFEGRSSLQTFICGILLNKIREHRRAMGKIVFDEDSETVMARSFTADGWWNVESPDPSRLVQSSQLSQLIAECLEGLTELQKAAFVLKEVEEEDSKEICNVLSITVSNLRVLIFRAKDKLRQCLEGKVDSSERT
jgi:RNA polymerase sigma-70 factor (ECF subfamily)